ncbi:Hsp20/alpha crystallin family protein [Candidatus Woesearchaeota archaeon]|nr:Hsp20/alpha crystallin family protein [Candidatus Woesearchaeota archaeon]
MKKELWDPFSEMSSFRKDMDKLFDNFWNRGFKPSKDLKVREPLVDIINKKDEIEAKVEIPGVDKKDVSISLDKNKVEIKAEKKIEKEHNKKDFFRQERSYSSFYKSFTLPAEIDTDKAKVDMKDGILTIKAPKLKQISSKKTLKLK